MSTRVFALGDPCRRLASAAGSARAEADSSRATPFPASWICAWPLPTARPPGSTAGLGKARLRTGRPRPAPGRSRAGLEPAFYRQPVGRRRGREPGRSAIIVVDLGEAYLAYRSLPAAGPCAVGRAGAFYPQISLEHDGLDWTVPDTITPSAINSWVAEETKVAGVEATARGALLGQGVSATVGAFTHGDTSGTLLSFRGWALHDLKSPVTGRFPLPPLTPFMARRQAPRHHAAGEIDGATGYYARLEWRPVSS
jgi:hypothetical protein